MVNDQLFEYYLDKFHDCMHFQKEIQLSKFIADSVWLLELCLAYGLDGSASELLVDYLRHRKQCFKIGTTRSSWMLLTKGLPQGSIFETLSFDIFINDLFSFVVNCTLYNYADDNSMSYSSTTLQTVLSNLRFDCKNYYWLVQSKRHESQSEQIPIHDFVIQCRRWHWIEIGQKYHS